jgi:hypothetical protein
MACKVTDGDLLVFLTNMAHLPLVFCPAAIEEAP